MTTCLFAAFFLGKSTTPTVAAEQRPSAVPESVGQHDPKTMQQLTEEGVGTSGTGKGKISRERMFQNPMLS